jgi:hypothetical protein
MTTTPSLWRRGPVGAYGGSNGRSHGYLVAIRRFLGMHAADSRSLRCDSYVRMQNSVRRYTQVPFRRFLEEGNMQRLYVALHSTLGYSYLHDALQEGSSSHVVACLLAPRA